ncbi:MAG: GGDEF domain-containing protein [Gaiellaceae bacterium]
MNSLSTSSRGDDTLAQSYRQLAEIYHDLLSREGLDHVLDRLVKTVTRLIPVASFLLAETQPEEGVLRPLVAEGGWPEGFLSSTLPFGEGLIGLTAERGRPILCNQAHLDPRAGHVAGTPTSEAEAIVCVPLVARGRVIGAMSLYREGEGAVFSELEFELAQRFGDAATLAIENARTRTELRELSRRDELTGLLNRRGFNDLLTTALAEGERQKTPVALVLIDLNEFKSVNDRYGHPAGDEILRQVANQLSGAARQSDCVCRVGGDEFAIVLPRSGSNEARIVADRIQKALAGTTFRLEASDVMQSASIGIASTDSTALRDPEQLLREADRGMYAEKRARVTELVPLKLVSDASA